MIAAQYVPGTGLRVGDVPIPRIGAGELLVRVEATAICGTDMKIIRNGSRRAKPGQQLVLGHEFVGVVEETGAGVGDPSPGTRVGVAPNFGCGGCEACVRRMANMCPDYSAFGISVDGSHASHIRIPAAAVEQGNVFSFLPEVKAEEAALAEPLSCVLNAQDSVDLGAGDTVLIYGAGPMGMLHVLQAVATGVSVIIVADINSKRLAAASGAGSTSTIDSSRESVVERVEKETGGRGVDVVFTAASVKEIVPEALQVLAPFGRLCLFAGLVKGDSDVSIDANMIHYRNLCITGTTGGSNAYYREAVDLITSGRVDVSPVISHVFPMSEMEKAFEAAGSGQGGKIVIKAE
jgi:L-iditol 2-dehydrogenase